MKVTKQLGELEFDFEKGAISIYCHLLYFLKSKDYNWITIRPIHFEIDIEYYVAMLSITLEILGCGINIRVQLPETEKSKATLKKLDDAGAGFAAGFYAWGEENIEKQLKEEDYMVLYRTKSIAKVGMENKVKKYFLQ